MSTVSRSNPFASGLLTMTALFTACDMGGQAPASDSGEQALLRLGEALSTGSALDRIGARFQVLDAADLGLSEMTMSPEDARQILAGVHGLGLNLGKVDRTALGSWKPLSDAAMELGVPLIIENIDDSEKLAELIGVGIEADVMMITSLGPNQYRVRVYGGNAADESLFESAEGELVVAQRSEDDISLAVDEISEVLRSEPARVVIQSVPATGYRYYDFDLAEDTFSPVDGQTASLSMDFEAELVLDPERGKKNVFIRPIGSGQHPGSLVSDGAANRGYYQESQEITITPNHSSVVLYAHAPATANSGATYTSSTGWTIGVSGQSPELNYSESNETSTTLPDFSMVNHTSGAIASWRFAMSTGWTNMFEYPPFEKCKVKSLPGLAKSNLKPEYEVLYRADDSFSSNVTFNLSKVTLLRRISRGGDIFTCNKHSHLWTLTRGRNVTIHFGSI
jgi:hypothetical protein